MPKKSEILTADLQKKLKELKETDILVGIPSYNNARTIGHVVRAVEAGLLKYFSKYKAILVNSDGGSTDGTMDVVKQAAGTFL
jgi:glycosyltransferase involved in cell wall biosynthesis